MIVRSGVAGLGNDGVASSPNAEDLVAVQRMQDLEGSVAGGRKADATEEHQPAP